MLIHKATLGVLWEVSSFRKDQQCWRRGLRLKDFPDLDPLEWWEVDDRTSLARRAGCTTQTSCRYPTATG